MNTILNFLKNHRTKIVGILGTLFTLLGVGGTVANIKASPEDLAKNAATLTTVTGLGAAMLGTSTVMGRRKGSKAPLEYGIELEDAQALVHLRVRARSITDPAHRRDVLAAVEGITAALYRLADQEAESATKQ